jgi:hypothetical protein
MKSPFPGMDPFIEASRLWEDFHDHLTEKLYEALADALPPKYQVRTARRSYVELVETEGKEARPFKPDVSVSQPVSEGATRAGTGVAIADSSTDAESVSLRAFVAEEFREKFVEVFEQDEEGLRLVTCVEVLSPSNKRKGSTGRKKYLRKRQALLLGQAHLVELDLLRGGLKMPMLDPWPDCPYTLLVCRQERAPTCHVFKAYSLKRLPVLPVPVASPDPDVAIDLQPMVEAIYARGRYFAAIDYTKPCRLSLSAEETSWLEERLKAVPPQT